MRKKLFIIISAIFVLCILVLFLLFSIPGSPLNPAPQFQIPEQLSPPPGQTSKLTSSIPVNNAQNVDPTLPIIFSFSETISGQPSISILPETEFTYTTSDTQLTITPVSPLRSGTRYVVSVHVNNLGYFTSFTTSGAAPSPLPDTKPENEPEERNEFLLSTRPDVYVSNNTPFENKIFSVSSRYDTATQRFTFVVISKSGGGTEGAFTAWLRELGLSASQISSLEIVYN